MNKRKAVLITAIMLVIAFVAIPAWAQYQTKVYFDNNGDRITIAEGGEWHVDAGATVSISEATYLQANAQMVVSAPTAIGTATPALVVNSSSNKPNLFEARSASTPVFAVGNTGIVSGKVLRYATASQQLICATQKVTDTATIASGLTTVAFCWADLHQAITGDAIEANCRTASAGNVVVDVKNSAVTPAANAAGADVTWCAIGTP